MLFRIEPKMRQLVLLAPTTCDRKPPFHNVTVDPERYSRLLSDMQRLRGTIYLKDGAIPPTALGPDGCHRQPADRSSWHILSLSPDGRIKGTVRCLLHTNPFSYDRLGVSTSALARSAEWGSVFRRAVERELAIAESSSLAYFEVGGWALSEDVRCTSEALRIALSTYGLGQIFGGALGISTATTRHHSASILRKLGGRPLALGSTVLPGYFEPKYGCQMEILRFDSWAPNPRFVNYIDELRAQLAGAPVICMEAPQSRRRPVLESLLPALAPAC